LYDYSVESVIQ